MLYKKPAQAEYQLIKTLYFSNYVHSSSVEQFLRSKQSHMLAVLSQFFQCPSRSLFFSHPQLLVIAELVADFPGSVPKLLNLPKSNLLGLAALGENGFKTLCSGSGFPSGLERLCRRIGNDYTRGKERRLHYILSMALLTIAQTIPTNTASPLVVPVPFLNLLTDLDIYNLHMRYTADVNIWFDGASFQVSNLNIPMVTPTVQAVPLPAVTIQPQTGAPSGTGSAAPNHSSRKRKRAARQSKVTVIIDQVLSEHAEDFVEHILYSQYGVQLIRAGHRRGETLSLPDGMVPGADFYVIDTTGNPIEFIEVKSISGDPPVDIQLTRAEYLRACRCAADGIPYRLILVDMAHNQWYEVFNFGSDIPTMTLAEVLQFAVRVG